MFWGIALVAIEKTDVSDFEGDEIRSVRFAGSSDELDKVEFIKLERKDPYIGNIGINKEKDIFIFQGGERGWQLAVKNSLNN